MKWFEDIFSKSVLMKVSAIIGILSFTAKAVIDLFTPKFNDKTLFSLFAVFILSCLTVSYKKGETSCQKALAGGVLAVTSLFMWTIALDGITYSFVPSLVTVEIISALFYTVVFINHLILQSEHSGKNTFTVICQVILFIAIYLQIVELLLQAFSKGEKFDFLLGLGFLSVITLTTCMETRIQKYKARRTKALSENNWTDEEREKSKKIFKL